jgi:4-aminobutyrate aminotransferase
LKQRVITHSKSRKYFEEYNKVVAPSTIDPETNLLIRKNEGMILTDAAGATYVDWDMSVAVALLGHRHPLIVEAITEQLKIIGFVEGCARQYMFTITVGGRRYTISPKALAKRLIRIVFPHEDARVIYEVAGGPGVNAAMKFLLKQRPERTHFFAIDGAFHGRHGYPLALTCSKPIQREDYPASGISVTHFPLPKSNDDMNTIERMLSRIPMKNVNAVVIEAIQGEGGIECWNEIYWKQFADIMRKRDIYVIADEIQSGLGRTGKMWAYQHFGMDPDIVIVGKGLGGGLVPMTMIVYKTAIEKKPLENGWHAGTFPQYPLGVTAATLTLDIIQRENLVWRARELGDYFEEKIVFVLPPRGVLARYCILKGKGLMRGTEFCDKHDDPDPLFRDAALRGLQKRGIVTIPCGLRTMNPTLRFLPPLTVTKQDIDALADALRDVV